MATMNPKQEWKRCLKCMVLAALASLAMLLATSIFLRAAFENHPMLGEIVTPVLMALAYAVCFYRFYMFDRLDTYAEHTDTFDVKAEVRAFLQGEGRIILIIYGICSVAAEIDLLIPRATPGRPVATACSLCITMICGYFPVPVLRSVLSFAVSVLIVVVLAILRSRKIHRERAANGRR